MSLIFLGYVKIEIISLYMDIKLSTFLCRETKLTRYYNVFFFFSIVKSFEYGFFVLTQSNFGRYFLIRKSKI